MSSKTRKFIWSVPVVAAFAVIGALAAFGVLGFQNAEPVEAQAVISLPGLPTSLTLTAENEAILIQWIAPVITATTSPPTGYEIQYIVQDDTEGAPVASDFAGAALSTVIVSGGATTGWRVPDLDNDEKEYFARIRSTNSAGESAWTAIAPTGASGANPVPTKPGTVQNLAVSLGSDNTELAVSWEAPTNDGGSDITSYVVSVTPISAVITCTPGLVAQGSGSDPDTCTLTGASLGTSTVVGGLVDGTAYTFTVTADNAATGTATANAGVTGTPTTPPSVVEFNADSTTSSGSVTLTLTLTQVSASSAAALGSGGSVELFLEDEYQVPDFISRGSVYFTVMNADGSANPDTGNGGPINPTREIVVNDGNFFDGDDDWAIQVYMPDLCTTEQSTCLNFNGPGATDTVTLVFTEASGIKNPSEEGDHSIGYKVLDTNDSADEDNEISLGDVRTEAKIALSDEDDGRGTEITLTGTGFNNGQQAEAWVLIQDSGAPDCATIINTGTSLGTATVGSDDKFSIVFTVHQDDFNAGPVNYICAKDYESPTNRLAVTDVEVFDMEPSVTADPTSAASGDEVTLKPRDFTDDITMVTIGGEVTLTNGGDTKSATTFMEDGSDLKFDMPGGFSGLVNLAVTDTNYIVRFNLDVTPSGLTLSKTEVAPNAAVIISGKGFSDGANNYICARDITIDDQPLDVEDAGTFDSSVSGSIDYPCAILGVSTDARAVRVTSNGDFTATVRIWGEGDINPALADDTYTVKAVDRYGYEGEASITIPEPTVVITPTVASPRDFITITGENWPISTSDDSQDVTITIAEDVTGTERTRTVDIDSTGRFNLQYQLQGNIPVGDTYTVNVRYVDVGGDIDKDGEFSVPESNVVIVPSSGAPGATVDLELTGMPIFTLVDDINISGADRLGGQNVNTDGNGNATVSGLLIPFLDPGFYPVEVVVGNETRVVQLEILADATVEGTATGVSEALSEIGDSLVRVFHFNNANKVWTFYDPRPEFDGLNTLTELANGQPYWILVSEAQENVVLNGKTRNLTCVGGDCWNQEVW